MVNKFVFPIPLNPLRKITFKTYGSVLIGEFLDIKNYFYNVKTNLLLLFCFVVSALFGQNLVPNPSFETYVSCPLNDGMIYTITPWTNPTLGTPDAHNSCSTSNIVNVPNNFAGYQNARTGNGYAGIYTYWPNYEIREYIQVPLLSLLDSGVTYAVSYYVCLGEKSSHASNNLGAYLSSNVLVRFDNLPFSSYTPQIIEPNVITDTLGWTKISGCFIANGGERYLTIGNFKTNENSLIPEINPSSSFWTDMSYYYIDDVSVVPLTPNFLNKELANDTALCEGDTLFLDASASNGSYLWQDNSTDSLYTVTEEGAYWVNVSNACGNTSDTVNVIYKSLAIELGEDTILCEGEELLLNAENFEATYLWQDNSTTSNINILENGTYWVEVEDGCNSLSDTIDVKVDACDVFIKFPNVFSPNGDGYNDIFTPIEINRIKELQTSIYNRWGQVVYASENLNIGWDGKTTSSSKVPVGNYYWVINYIDEYDNKGTVKGYVLLLRD